MNRLSQSYGLNNATTNILQELIWHLITYKVLYDVKQRSQIKPNQINIE